MVGAKVGAEIFTDDDAKVVRQIWQGPRGTGGRFLWYGLVPGSDMSVLAATKGTPLTGNPSGEGLDWFRYYLLQNPNWDWKTLTREKFELLFNQSVEELGPVIGTDDPDLGAFRDHGGKMLIIHGLNDQIVPVSGTIQYYREVQRRMGGPQRAAEFARLFLLAGQGHGFSAKIPAPSLAETVRAITAWVEDGQAPGAPCRRRFRQGTGTKSAPPALPDRVPGKRRLADFGGVGTAPGRASSLQRSTPAGPGQASRRGDRFKKWSGRRGSNSRRPPWQGGALPTELRPRTGVGSDCPPSRRQHHLRSMLSVAGPRRRLPPFRFPPRP